MAAKIKKGDKVVVLTGKDKGKTGQVLSVIPTALSRRKRKLTFPISRLLTRKKISRPASVLRPLMMVARFASRSLAAKSSTSEGRKNDAPARTL